VLSGENQPETLDILSAAHAELGRFAEALEIAREAPWRCRELP